jgi:hypothetical protein
MVRAFSTRQFCRLEGKGMCRECLFLLAFLGSIIPITTILSCWKLLTQIIQGGLKMNQREIVKLCLESAYSLYNKDLKIGSLLLNLDNEPAEFLFHEIDYMLNIAREALGICKDNDYFTVTFFDCVFDKVNLDEAIEKVLEAAK